MFNRKYIDSIRVHFPACYVRLPECSFQGVYLFRKNCPPNRFHSPFQAGKQVIRGCYRPRGKETSYHLHFNRVFHYKPSFWGTGTFDEKQQEVTPVLLNRFSLGGDSTLHFDSKLNSYEEHEYIYI